VVTTADRNFAILALLIALLLDLAALFILVAVCNVHADAPLANTLCTGAVGIGGALGGLATPSKAGPQ
jgi:hypothetical protein